MGYLSTLQPNRGANLCARGAERVAKQPVTTNRHPLPRFPASCAPAQQQDIGVAEPPVWLCHSPAVAYTTESRGTR
jgi:hypothetical protein